MRSKWGTWNFQAVEETIVKMFKEDWMRFTILGLAVGLTLLFILSI